MVSAKFRVADGVPAYPHEGVAEISMVPFTDEKSADNESRFADGEAVGAITLTVSKPEALDFFSPGKVVTVNFEDQPSADVAVHANTFGEKNGPDTSDVPNENSPSPPPFITPMEETSAAAEPPEDALEDSTEEREDLSGAE